MSVKKNLIAAGIVLSVVAAGVGLRQWGYADGRFDGEEYGRFAQREYEGTKGLADACYEYADVYDAEPDAEKIKRGYPLKFDRKSCEKIVRVVNSYAPKGVVYEIPAPGAVKPE